MTIRLWPASLAGRTAVVLLVGLVAVQGAGLTIHALDRLDVQRLAQARDLSFRASGLYRAMALTDPARRAEVLDRMRHPPDLSATVSDAPPQPDLPEMPPMEQRLIRLHLNMVPFSDAQMPWRDIVIYGGPPFGRVVMGLRLPDGTWLNIADHLDPLRPWHSPTFLVAFVLMTLAAAVLTLWTVRRLIAPVRVLAEAAEALGRDVNAPPLPETGPSEVRTAAIAFNTMAMRIRRFVQDRTELLTAIGHDLRTPITRLKLRAEFVEDDEQRAKILADLEELEAMVSATLAFGRDARSTEPLSPIDLAELLRTIVDEVGDAWPSAQEVLRYEGPSHLTLQVRPLSLKRAFVNLVANAVHYGGGAVVRLSTPRFDSVVVEVEDEGPGIPAAEIDRVFEPFHRGDPSRSRETGGVGLGLPIARNIFRAHGGDVTLVNRAPRGLKATVTLPR
ncbi:ATP-binding protein [Rhodopila sp.]|uniref:ATP-binding protein n=1 Tax=Rhodopila sp. TaxID=2480087 RepID=UPI002BA6F51F|nr:ATP-binding protein [Rhodopila sp.]HVZ06906.1 ATP-binding protein [Rhodopila sp.]